MTRRMEIPRELARQGLDALVAVSMDNVYYSSGALILTQRMIPSRLALVVWTPSGEPTMIVCTLEEVQVRSESWIKDIRGYIEFVHSPVAVLAQVLKEKGLERGRIGLETRSLSMRYYREFETLVPNARLVDGDEVFDRVRMIKSADEIEVLSKGAAATNAAIRRAFEAAQVNTSEMDMTDVMTAELLKKGADGLAFVVMTTGGNSRLTHPVPSDLRIKSGDLVRTDSGGNFGSYFGCYYSDIARTAFAGKPTDKQRTMYAKLYEVHDLVLRSVKPGVRACDLYQICKRGFEQRGISFDNPHIGHGLGIAIHEHPMLNPQTTEELQPGMVMSVEPIVKDDEGLIYHLEDTVEVTSAGGRILSSHDQWQMPLAIR